MDILSYIQNQAEAMRLPLYAVTLSAVAKPGTPLLLTLYWHGFFRETTVRIHDSFRVPLRSVPGSALQLDLAWSRAEHLDEAMLEAAWRLGAWDLERVTHRPWWRLNAPLSETLACHRAFAHYPDMQDSPVLVDAPDQERMLEAAALRGYIRWLFRPRAQGVWAQIPGDDVTLESDLRRTGPCPVPPAAFDRHRPGRHVYRLGTGDGLLIYRA